MAYIIDIIGEPISNSANQNYQRWIEDLRMQIIQQTPNGAELRPPYRLSITLILDPGRFLDNVQYPWAGDLDNYLSPILNELKTVRGPNQQDIVQRRPLCDDNAVLEINISKRFKFHGENQGVRIEIHEIGLYR
jgi:Holliday junction resolvase RusA-like endonuclease